MFKLLNRRNSGKKGFTLIELLVVIAIIGILASIVLASLNTARRKSRDARRVADLGQIRLANELYFDSNSSYPGGATWADLLDDLVTDAACGGSACIASLPNDPLNSGSNVYTYQGLQAAAVCAAAAGNSTGCVSYVVKAVLEDSTNQALGNDIDGATQNGVAFDCADTIPAYCVRP